VSVYFQCLGIELRNGAEFEKRANYGGKFDHILLQSNSAHRLPFAILMPDIGPWEIESELTPCVANFKRHIGHMPANGGGDFENYQLVIRPMTESWLPLASRRRGRVIIERLHYDVLPLADFPSGFAMPEQPGLPTADDPIVVSSHTKDGGGWYTYKIYVEEE
jgi:hypothetical protein